MEGLRTHRFWLAFFLACVLHALGTNLAAVRGFRKLRITSSTAFGVAVYWFRTQPRSEGAKRNVLWIPKVAGSIFLACVFNTSACLSSACCCCQGFCQRRGVQLLLGCFGSVPPKALDGSFDVVTDISCQISFLMLGMSFAAVRLFRQRTAKGYGSEFSC